MSRDNFISDNLIKIRENLRQNPVKSPVADEPRINFSADNAKVDISITTTSARLKIFLDIFKCLL